MNQKTFMRICTIIVVLSFVCFSFVIIRLDDTLVKKAQALETEKIEKREKDIEIVRKTEDKETAKEEGEHKEFDISNAKNIFEFGAGERIFNNEIQLYLDNQVKFEGNRVLLTAEKIGMNYVSGRVESKVAFRYGTFSFRINPVYGKGLFPAVWCLPQSNESFPEIDIFELIGNEPEKLYGVMHYMNDGKQDLFQYTHSYDEDNIPDTYVVSFKWSEDELVWYLDGKEMLKVTEHVPHIPEYMILNYAIGGNWPGNPDENTEFPSTFGIEILEFSPEEIFTRQ